jgi:hypothetical protein
MSESHETGAMPSVESRPSNTELLWNFLGLQVARKTEILALAAFVLSMSGVLLQVIVFARGAVVTLFATDQIVMTATDKLGRNYTGQDNLLALIATMAYTNDGDTGHNAVVRREYLTFSLGDRHIEHRWYEFGSSDVQDGSLIFKRESEARPFPINAGSAVSHETLFTAWEIDCEGLAKGCDPAGNFVKWDDFLKIVRNKNVLSFATRAEIYPSKSVTAACVVRLRDWEIDVLERQKWLSAACTELGKGDRPQQKSPR